MALDKGFDLFLKFSFIFFNKLGGIWSKTKRNKDNGTATFGRRVKCSGQASPPASAWPGRAVAESRPKTWEGRKPITVLGSTGSIGTQVLKKVVVADNNSNNHLYSILILSSCRPWT